MPMASITVALGAVLLALGLGGYFLTGGASVTALIPAAFGVVLALAGWVAREERRRKHAMHVAVAIALLGFLGSVRGLVQIGDAFAGTAERPAAVISQSIMAILTGVYLVIAIRSFMAARRPRRES